MKVIADGLAFPEGPRFGQLLDSRRMPAMVFAVGDGVLFACLSEDWRAERCRAQRTGRIVALPCF